MPAKVEIPELYSRFIGKQPMSKKRLAALITGGLVVLVGAVAGIGSLLKPAAGEHKKQPVLTVAVAPASTIHTERSMEISGTISAADPIVVGSEVNGLRIVSVHAEEGDFVRRGQVLVTLNSSILKAQLAREKARLKQFEANYAKAVQPNRTYEIDAIKAAYDQALAVVSQEEFNIARAEANLANARNFATRYSTLSKQGAISEQDADNKNAAKLMAEAELSNAQHRLSAARSAARMAKEKMDMFVVGGRKEDVQAAAATVEEIKANIQTIESQIAQTIIRAPADGTITKRDAHVGEIGTAMQIKPLFNMIKENRLEVRAQVPETDLPRLRTGQIVQFTGPDGSAFTGKLSIITPQVDSDTRLATLRIEIPYSPELRPGIFVHGKVRLAADDVLVIPAKAAVSRDDYTLVFALDGDHVIQRNVKLGDRFGDQVEVLSGVQPGERLIVSGAGFLKDGDLVRVSQ